MENEVLSKIGQKFEEKQFLTQNGVKHSFQEQIVIFEHN